MFGLGFLSKFLFSLLDLFMASEITPLVFTLQLKLDSLDNLLLYVVVYTIFALLLLFC